MTSIGFSVKINVTIGFGIKFNTRQCCYVKLPKFRLWSFFSLSILKTVISETLLKKFKVILMVFEKFRSNFQGV